MSDPKTERDIASEQIAKSVNQANDAKPLAKLTSRLQALGLPEWLIQLLLFGLIGLSGMFVDLFIVFICHEGFGIDVRYGMFPAFLVAVTWNYEFNRRITFRKQQVGHLFSYAVFFLTAVVGLGLRWIVTHSAIEYLGMQHDRYLFSWQIPILRLAYIAYVIGIIAAYIFNFLGSKFIAFKHHDSD
jgi:putative flippase GtrA